MCYFSHLVYPIAWCHATQMDHAGSGQVLTINSYGLRHLIQHNTGIVQVCHACGEMGHAKRDCPTERNDGGEGEI